MAKSASTKQGGRNDPAASDRRRQARAAQQAALAKAKRRRALTQVAIIGGVAVVVIAIIATAVLVGRRGTDAATGGGPSFSGSTTLGGTSVPLVVGGSQAANGIRVGSTDAKVTMDLWVDYSCPHCQEFEAANNAAIGDLVAAGKLAVTYHNIQIVTDYGTEAGSASACVAVHDPNAWPAFNAALYANHSAQTDGWSASQLAAFAASNGAGDASRTCITDGTYRGWIDDNTAASVKADVSGTPTMFLNGEKTDTLSGQALVDRVNSLASA